MEDAKANARAAAIRRTGGSGKVAKKASGKGGDSFAFLSGNTQGFEVSPKAVLIISLLYIGVVVLLHIFGKVKSAATAE